MTQTDVGKLSHQTLIIAHESYNVEAYRQDLSHSVTRTRRRDKHLVTSPAGDTSLLHMILINSPYLTPMPATETVEQLSAKLASDDSPDDHDADMCEKQSSAGPG